MNLHCCAGLQLPEHIIRKLQDAIIAKRPAAAAAGRVFGWPISYMTRYDQ